MDRNELPLGGCGCEGDSDGLTAAIGDDFVVLHSRSDDYGYGHHTYNAVIATSNGSFIHAECGGCSCEGSGTWTRLGSLDEALSYLPLEQRRDALAKLDAVRGGK